MICPQVGCDINNPRSGCGCIMVLDPNKCLFNERGPACWTCTTKSQEKNITYIETAMPHLQMIRNGATCVLCLKQLTNQQACKIYPGDTYLCKSHSTKAMKTEVEQWVAMRKKLIKKWKAKPENKGKIAQETIGHQEMEEALYKIDERMKLRKRSAKTDFNNRKLRASKLSNFTKRMQTRN